VNEPLLNHLTSGKPPKLGRHISVCDADYSYRYRL